MSGASSASPPPGEKAAPKRSWCRRLMIGAAILVGIGAATVAAVLWPRTMVFYTDADTIRVPAQVAALREVLWQPPVQLPDLINTESDDYEPRLSADGMTLYFVRGKAGDNADVYRCTRTPDGWTEPVPVVELNTEYDELGAEPSADGRSIYFYSNRPGGQGGYDLWAIHRGLDGESGFSAPVNLGPRVNSEYNDYGPALTADGKTLYFASNRPQPRDADQPDPDAWPGTIREDLYHRTYDLFMAPLTEQGPGDARPLAALNTPYNEGAPAVSPVGDFVYFASDRPGGEGAFDVYRSRRLRGVHQPADNLGDVVNTAANELDPGMTLGGFALYFSSDRPAQRSDPEKPNPYHVFQTTSREVFTETETRQVSIDWAALWSEVGPNLLWALLALLLLLLLLVVFRDLQRRRLSLLARCLLASIAAHLLLMLLFNVWGVTVSLARELKGRGRIQIALAAPVKGNDISTQIRGEFTEVDTPPPVQLESERAASEIAVEPVAEPANPGFDHQPVRFEHRLLVDRRVVEAEPESRPDVPDSTPDSTRTERKEALDLAVPFEERRVDAAEEASSFSPDPVADSAGARMAIDRVERDTTAADQPIELPPDRLSEYTRLPRRSLAEFAPNRPPRVDVPSPVPSVGGTAVCQVSEAEFGLALPKDDRRISDSENGSAPAPAPVAEVLSERLAIDRIERVPAVADQPIELPPDRLSEDTRLPRHSLAEFAPNRPVVVDVPSPNPSVDEAAAWQAPEAQLGLALPHDERRVQEAEDASITRPVPVADATSARLAVDSVDGVSEVSDYPVELVPDRVVDDLRMPPRSLAARTPNRASNVEVSSPTLLADATTVSSPPTFELDLALPQAQQPGVDQEHSQLPAAEMPESVRSKLSPRTVTSPDVPVVSTMKPASPATAGNATSLADASRPRESDLPGAANMTAPIRADGLDTPYVPNADLALPTVEEIPADVRNEPAVLPQGTVVDGLRKTLPLIMDVDTPESPRLFDPIPHLPFSAQLAQHGLPLRKPRTEGAAVAVPGLAVSAPRDHDSLTPSQAIPNLRLPGEVVLPDDTYAQRARAQRLAVVKGMGGSEATEEAVRLALKWLAAHQSDDGRWDGRDFDDNCGECGGQTDIEIDTALTGLALLCFLAADHTNVKEGPYRANVERGLQWLLRRQAPNGDFRGEETMYSQGIATIALAEAYGMTRDSRLAEPLRKAVRFIDQARDPSSGVWRYEPGQPGDTSVLGWQIMAFKSAREAGLEVPMDPFVAARDWLDDVSPSSHPGLYAYQPGQRVTVTMTAEGLFIQQLLGRRRSEPRMQESVAVVLDHLPGSDDDFNTYFWYYGTLALFHHQGEAWRTWNEALTEQLLTRQRRDGSAAGSWNPEGKWAKLGGRIYQTTLCTLMLEVYYRYLPLFLQERPLEAIGTITGRVTHAETDAPIAGARVRLDLPDSAPIEVVTDTLGRYSLFPPEVPTFFALSASAEGYLPDSKNVATAMVKGAELALDFSLEEETQSIVALESEPEVHHLGDDQFDGRINSQFQRKAEGSRYTGSFTLSARQLPPHYNTAEITILVKGVQLSSRIRVNGRTIPTRLDWSPRDGSFGEFTASLNPDLLRAGDNTFEILSSSTGSDIDDFEFVNIQIHLSP